MRYIVTVFFIVLFSSLLTAQHQTEFSGENALLILHHLSVDIGPRPMGSPADHIALQFAVDKFKEYGCDTSYIMPMMTSTRAITNSGIAVGIKRGATNRIICLGGHIDSEGPEVPGADDDGSGASTIMELAQVLAKRHNQSTVVFCCFSGEEQGLEGSKYFVDHFAQLDSIVLMLQVDMDNGLGIIDMAPDAHGVMGPKWLVKAAVEEFNNLGYQHLQYPGHFFSFNYSMGQGSGSDHESFIDKGIPAIDFSTDVSKPIHTPRDNYENFQPGGLQRTGDLYLRLFERFDGGVPKQRTEQYWLYLLGSTPVFLDLGILKVFDGVVIAIALIALFAVYKRRPVLDPSQRIRWSNIKVYFFTLILVSFAWFANDLISLIQGVRHPWITNETYYFLYAFLSFLIGSWVAARLSRKFRVTRNSFALYLPAFILLLGYTIALMFLGIKTTIYPALGLFFISLAIIVTNPSIRFVLLLLAPLPVLRFIFSEWSIFLIRVMGISLPSTTQFYWGLSGGFIVFFIFALVPFVYAFAGMLRDTPVLSGVRDAVRSNAYLSLVLIGFCALTLILIKRPGYDKLWYKNLKVNDKIDMVNHTQEVNLSSSEYLKGLNISHGGIDTAVTTKITSLSIQPHTALDTTWFHLDRKENKTQSGDTVTYDIMLTLLSKFRPFQMVVSYDGGKDDPSNFSSTLFYRNRSHHDTFTWYSFPDTNVILPVKFSVIGQDTVHETISVMFDTLAYPMKFLAEKTYEIPRTEYVSEKTYKK